MESLLAVFTNPLVILGIGLVTVVGMIIVLRVNAFLALITAAMLVSLLAPGALHDKIARVAMEFGKSAGNIGIVIAMAAIIGKCLMDSGAADRIVRSFLRVLGEKRSAEALTGASFVLAVPVFFDTVFYLMVPLARSLWRSTRKNYVLYVLAIATGGAITHAMVPPTPGPLMMADQLGIDIGVMILVGAMIGLPTAAVGLLVARVMNRMVDIPCRPYTGEAEPEPLADDQLPSLAASLAPILLPVLLISTNTVTGTLAKSYTDDARPPALAQAAEIAAVLGNANLALLLSGAIAMLVLVRQRKLKLAELARATETALMSGGVIILITASGGAFGAMLKAAQVGPAVEAMFSNGGASTGTMMLVIGFAVGSILKIAQGSSTVAMITASSMLAAMGASPERLGFNPVYLATAIAGGATVGSWMNDSGFWIFARMSGFTEVEALKSWTIILAIVGTAAFGFTLLAARVLPLV